MSNVDSDKHRLQFDFSPEAFRSLKRLREKAGAKSNAEVVRDSLRFYEWLLVQLDEGREIQTAKGDDVKAIQFVGIGPSPR